MTLMNVVELTNVVKKFGEVSAANNVSFEVGRGKIISLLGPSGSGKTTILRMIAGFETPDSGKVIISGKDMHGKRPYERNVGLLFQDYALFPHMTVEENIGYGMKRRGMGATMISSRVSEMLELVKLVGLEKRRPNQLSGGQQQRVALVRALATEPDVLLLDEPLSALDAKLRHELRVELKEILASVETTTIVVTHDQEEAMSLAEHVIVQNHGNIMQQGTPTEIYARPKNKFVADFLGRSNWFEGRLTPIGTEAVWRFETDDGLSFVVPFDGNYGAEKVEVCVRQERMVVSRGERDHQIASDHQTNFIAGTVVEMAHLVADVHIVVETEAGRRIAAIEKNIGQPLNVKGDKVTLGFSMSDCLLVT